MIQTPYLANFWNKPSQPLRFYKYISLNTYHNMLTSHKFRMIPLWVRVMNMNHYILAIFYVVNMKTK